MWAAHNGHTATAAELVRLSADINAKSKVRIRRSASCARGAGAGGTAWRAAAVTCDWAVARLT
jgi:hypothetical protein